MGLISRVSSRTYRFSINLKKNQTTKSKWSDSSNPDEPSSSPLADKPAKKPSSSKNPTKVPTTVDSTATPWCRHRTISSTSYQIYGQEEDRQAKQDEGFCQGCQLQPHVPHPILC